jgi:hypothetical protein
MLARTDRLHVYARIAARVTLASAVATRSHLASELADWRADYVGSVVPGACSSPGPALSCAAGNGGVRGTG